jgi:hypothetical protein
VILLVLTGTRTGSTICLSLSRFGRLVTSVSLPGSFSSRTRRVNRPLDTCLPRDISLPHRIFASGGNPTSTSALPPSHTRSFFPRQHASEILIFAQSPTVQTDGLRFSLDPLACLFGDAWVVGSDRPPIVGISPSGQPLSGSIVWRTPWKIYFFSNRIV